MFACFNRHWFVLKVKGRRYLTKNKKKIYITNVFSFLMKKVVLIILILGVLILQNVSANFVCGEVMEFGEYSPVWMDVIVYYESNPDDVSTCRINAQKKFCCDLEEIKSVSFGTNKRVFAELFDGETGFVSERVSLITTSGGFSIFPEMSIKKAITINSNFSEILIGENGFFMNFSLAEQYNNLKYSISDSDGFSEEILCEECLNYGFYLNLSKGKNTITFTAYNSKREIEESFEVYSLDYFKIKRDIICDGCRKNGENDFLVPSGELISVNLFLNSSHEISGKITDYFPVDFEIEDDSLKKDYSSTHNAIDFDFLGKEFLALYNLKSPSSIFPTTYTFNSYFNGFLTENRIRVTRIRFWPQFLYLNNLRKESFFNLAFNKINPQNPLIIYPENNFVELVAIYPKEKKNKVHASLDSSKISSKEEIFNIITSLSDNEIDKILIKIKSEKNKDFSLISENKEIILKKYKEDGNYDYYEAWTNNKQFKIRL